MRKPEPGIQNLPAGQAGPDTRHRKKLFFVCVLSSVLFILSYGVAFSSEGTEHVFSWKQLFWPFFNFIILVVILVLAGRTPIKDFFKKRTEMIEKSLREAEEAKEFAKKSLKEVREQLKNTDREMKEILEAARKSGEKEKEEIIAEGERLKNKILEQAKANIEFELKKAKEAIKSEAVIMALELAEKQIKEKLGKEEQEILVEEYIKKLETTK